MGWRSEVSQYTSKINRVICPQDLKAAIKHISVMKIELINSDAYMGVHDADIHSGYQDSRLALNMAVKFVPCSLILVVPTL